MLKPQIYLLFLHVLWLVEEAKTTVMCNIFCSLRINFYPLGAISPTLRMSDVEGLICLGLVSQSEGPKVDFGRFFLSYCPHIQLIMV